MAHQACAKSMWTTSERGWVLGVGWERGVAAALERYSFLRADAYTYMRHVCEKI